MQHSKIGTLTSDLGASPSFVGNENVVEIGLLLPAKRAEALIRLAKDRQESVGQILRKLIERELALPA